MPTINQLVRKGRKKAADKSEDAGTQGQPAEARSVHPRVHDDTEEAELGPS